MGDKDLMDALKQMSQNEHHNCLGCGHEHNCSIHGCAVLNAAVERIRALAVEVVVLRLKCSKVRDLCAGIVMGLSDPPEKLHVSNLDTK